MTTTASRPASGSGTNPILDRLIEELTNQIQSGEPIDLEALIQQHPEHADQLRQLLPALEVLADLGRSAARGMPLGPGPGAETGVLGDFRILGEIGRGGMGVVYEAEQISLGRRVALKVLPFAAALDPRQLQRFKVEAQAAAQLHHTHIVPIFSVGVERGVHYYAMQFIEGRTLAEVIRELRRLHGLAPNQEGSPAADRHPAGPAEALAPGRSDAPESPTQEAPAPIVANRAEAVESGPRPEILSSGSSIRSRAFFQAAARLGIQAAEALEYAHSLGVVHRDIKPANLLLDARGQLWVTDFGLAQVQAEGGLNLTLTGDVLGTLRYMSPEQALGRRTLVDHRTDLYSLGVTLYELLTLHPAIEGTDRQEILRRIAFEETPGLRRHNPEVPRELETIVLKAIATEPEGRYTTAQELADDLKRFLEHKPILARRPSLVERAAKWCRRHTAAVATMVGILILAGIGLAVVTALIVREEAEVKRQRDVARERLALARTAVDEMYTQVATQWLEQQPRLDGAQRDFLLKALAAYERFAREEESPSPAMQRGLALASQRAGQIRLRLGEFPAAESDLRRALAIQEDLVSRSPSATEYLRDQAATYRSLALLLETTGRLEESLAVSRRAVAVLTELAADFPRDSDLRRSLARDCVNLGRVLLLVARFDESEQVVRRGLELGRALVHDFPGEPENSLLYARSLDALATLLADRGRPAEGLELGRESVEIHKKLASDFAAEPNYRLYLAGVYGNLGYLLSRVGRRSESIDAIRRAVKVQRELSGDFPSRPSYRHYLSLYLTNLGDSLLLTAQPLEAVTVIEQARKNAEALVAEHPAVPDYSQQLGRIFKLLGKLQAQMGRTAEAEASFGRAVAIFDKLVKDDANRWDDENSLANTYLSWICLLSYGTARGGQDPTRAVPLAEKAVARCPRSREVWAALGLARSQARDQKGAFVAIEKALALDSTEDGDLWLMLALAHARSGDHRQALGWYKKAIAWMKRPTSGTFELRDRLTAEVAALLRDAGAIEAGAGEETKHSK